MLTASPAATSFATNPPCSFVLREAGLPLQYNTQNHTHRVQSTNQVPIDDTREEAVPQGQDKGSFRQRFRLGCHSRPAERNGEDVMDGGTLPQDDAAD